MTMKKLLCMLLALALMLSATVAFAEEALDAKIKMNGRNASFTLESVPEIVITPVFADYIINEYDLEKYPARYIEFMPPEGALPLEFRSDLADYLDFDQLIQYSYYAYDRMAFELFLEKAEPEDIIKDGSDGTAIFIEPDNRRARAMIDMKEQFGGTAKLEIYIYDHRGNRDADALKKLIEDETDRVMGEMKTVDGPYWSQNRYNSVELYDSSDAGVTVDTSGWTITTLETKRIISKERGEGTSTTETEIEIGSYVRDEAVDAKLADGTEYRLYNTDYTGYAFFHLGPGQYSGEVYLEITIGVGPEEFPQALEEVYKRITIKAE